MPQTNWMEQFVYPSNKYHKVLQKYCDAFKQVFRCEMKVFTYEPWMKNGFGMGVSNEPKINEIYLENEGYKDNPFFVEYDLAQAGSIFWPDQTKVQMYNNFKDMLQKKLDIRTSFSILEKAKDCCYYFSWDFKSPPETLNIQQEKNIILEDFVNNYPLIQAIIEQFKTEFFPIIDKEELCSRVNLKELSTVYNKDNGVINQNSRINDPGFLLNANIIKTDDLKLMKIKFTKLEQTILKLYLRGMTADEISKCLTRSRRTIETQICNIKDKVGCNKRSEVYDTAEKLKLMRVIT